MAPNPTPTVRVFAGGSVVLERDVGIVARDGTRLSCDVYRPNRAGRFPSVLEHIPYRKDDLRVGQDRVQGIYLARRGVVTVRLDVRGTGSSDGVAVDEYSVDEQRDGVDAVAWMAAQPWSNGRVGAWGISYGGFTCLQLAAQRPPALGAIAAVHATDDRYTDECHYFGGAVAALELAVYPARMLASNALPPRGAPGEDLLARWRARVMDTPPWVLGWLREQLDGPFWRNGSVRPDYARIACPVLLVTGWRDGYRSAALRLARELRVPWQLVAGPWAHAIPDLGEPGPPYPLLDELARFFRHHLAGDAPAPRPRALYYRLAWDAPSAPSRTAPGAWVASDAWPDATGAPRVLDLGPGGALGPASAPDGGGAETVVPIATPCTVGATSGKWCPPGGAWALPSDQRPDDARSVAFTSAPLDAPLDVFGEPSVELRVGRAGGNALLAVKLCDVAPDGESALVTRGLLNLSHRAGDAEAVLLAGPTDVRVALLATSWRFLPGHRVRVVLATSDWPAAWPLPDREPLELHLGGAARARVTLPAPPCDAREVALPERLPEEVDMGGFAYAGEPAAWRVVSDAVARTGGVEGAERGAWWLEGESVRAREARTFAAYVGERDPLSAEVRGDCEFEVERDGLRARAAARTAYRADAGGFDVELELVVHADDRELVRRAWRERIPRRGC